MAWWDERMCSVDCETTGPDPETARVVQLAVVMVGGGEATEEHAWLVDPGVEIPEEATAVHGITTAMVREKGLLSEDAIAQALDVIGDAPGAVIAFNARFDFTVLEREAERHDLRPLSDRIGEVVVDPHVLDKWLDRYRKGSRQLVPTCIHRGVVLAAEEAHGAAADALAAARLAWVIGAKGRVVRRKQHEREPLQATWDEIVGNLEALHVAQVEMAREQAEGLAQHFREKGKVAEAARVRTEWPFQEVVGRV